MAKPVILLVDDEAQVLNAIARDVRSHFRGDYRILKAGSGQEGLEVVQQLRQRSDSLALIVSDQRMPTMEGTDFLEQAQGYYPNVRKVLLTAYADTEAAIQSINTIGLDYYLLKPWDPPEDNLYPVLDDLLDDWLALAVQEYQGIRVVGTLWSPASHDIKDFLSRNRVPFKWVDIEREPNIDTLLETFDNPDNLLPVVILEDGEALIAPTNTELATKVGLQTQAELPLYDLVIVGGGPAGLAAAVYGASEGLSTVLIEKEATGGQAGTSSRIENYLGFPKGISGGQLAQRAVIQAERLGAEILTAQEVSGIRLEDNTKVVQLADGSEIVARAVLLATGVTVRILDKPGVDRLSGAGIYYGAAMTEAAHYKDQSVYVIGGANSAGQAAVFFARYASKVSMLVRGEGLRQSMSAYLIDQLNDLPNVELRPYTEVVEAHGDKYLEKLTLINNQTQETWDEEAAAMFIFIGARPHTDMVAGLVQCNDAGFILTGPDLIRDGDRIKGWHLSRDPYLQETSVPGIFAAGDVRHGVVRRVASAVGQGSIAVSFVHRYLETI